VDTDVGGVLPNVRRTRHRFCARDDARVSKAVRGGVGHRRSGEAADTTLNEAASCLMVRINPRSRRVRRETGNSLFRVRPAVSLGHRADGRRSVAARAGSDWAERLWLSPDKQAELAHDAATKEHRPIQPVHPTVAMYDSGIGVERREPGGKTRRLRPCAPTARRIRPLITVLMDCGRSNRRATC
jgi:hypothetical protein